MNLSNIKIPDTGIKLVPVPSEKLKLMPSQYRTVNNEYEILDYIPHVKGEYLPSALTIISNGVLIEEKDIWIKYPKSDKIIFFICRKKIDNSTK